MVVLPVSMVEEIRALPSNIANPTSALAHNLLGYYTKMDQLLGDDLLFCMVQTKLTPALGSLTVSMESEVKYAIDNHFPKLDEDWVTIKPYPKTMDLIASTSARFFVGLPLCRSETWLEIPTHFTGNSKTRRE